jgi:ABC-type Na+ efflux pump permease subunit
LKVLLDYNITPSEQAIARAETRLSNMFVFWFSFVVIVCSPFVVAGGSAYSLTMGDSSKEEKSTQGFILTMSLPA